MQSNAASHMRRSMLVSLNCAYFTTPWVAGQDPSAQSHRLHSIITNNLLCKRVIVSVICRRSLSSTFSVAIGHGGHGITFGFCAEENELASFTSLPDVSTKTTPFLTPLLIASVVGWRTAFAPKAEIYYDYFIRMSGNMISTSNNI